MAAEELLPTPGLQIKKEMKKQIENLKSQLVLVTRETRSCEIASYPSLKDPLKISIDYFQCHGDHLDSTISFLYYFIWDLGFFVSTHSGCPFSQHNICKCFPDAWPCWYQPALGLSGSLFNQQVYSCFQSKCILFSSHGLQPQPSHVNI